MTQESNYKITCGVTLEKLLLTPWMKVRLFGWLVFFLFFFSNLHCICQMESDGFKPRIGIMCQRWYSNVSYQFIYFFSDVDVSLTEIKKRKVDSGKQLRNNMWCNFGTVVIEDMDEGSFVRLVGWLVFCFLTCTTSIKWKVVLDQ